MADKNRTREITRQRNAAHKDAFVEIFGDPFSRSETQQGHYQTVKSSSSGPSIRTDMVSGRTTSNPARPSAIDFLCDVEHIARIALTAEEDVHRFTETYIHETTTTAYTREERYQIEQNIGRLLRAYGISPVSRYFTSIRQRTN